ncbi:MAG: tyrosine-type recombinase/integrase [Candidatus Marinimicrobia bacterium]|nr:tyrosine-type recombinase/integrase [Candidatus Neomarinimicrobiota bacterium]
MKKNIRPFTSKKARKNIYDYHDKETNTVTKVAGFDIYLYNQISGGRIRKRIVADYQAVTVIVDKIKAAIKNEQPAKIDSLSGKRSKTLEDLFNAFKRNKLRYANRVGNGISDLTIKRYFVALKSLCNSIKPDLLEVKISRITSDFVDRRLEKRIRKGLSLKTLNTDITHLKAIFNWGVEHRYLDHNPMKAIAKFKVQPSKPRILSVDEWDTLWGIAKYSKWRPLILTYLFTGARASEIVKPKLSWDDINFEKGTITLENRKWNKSLMLPMPKILVDEFAFLKKNPIEKQTSRREDDKLYPFPFHSDYVSHAVKDEILIPAGLGDVTVHDLRRTFGSYLIHLGVPVTVVSQLMSHGSTRTTEQFYIGQLDSVQREAIDSLADFILPKEKG